MKHFVEWMLLPLKQKHLQGEIKDERMSSFSSDHQTLVKHQFLWIINEFEKYQLRKTVY